MGSPSLLTTLLLLLAGVLIARLSAGRLARWAIPAILLELLVGVFLGNTLLPYAAIGPLSGLMELGVLTLFFQVGLEVRGDLLASRRGAILRTVALSALVPLLAYAPVQATYGLTSGATLLMLAALSATGTGVTLRLLAQRGALGTPSGRLLVGVSVLDDLPAIALLTLATLTGGAASAQGGLAWLGLPLGLGVAAVSWWAAGLWMRRRSERPQNPLALLILLISCAWVGEVSGLSSLLGALWAGVLLSRLRGAEANHPSHDEGVQGTFQVLTDVFLPLYFISVGMRLPLAALLEPRAWALAAGLIALAMLSKAVCALGIWRQDVAAGVDRALVVFGLIPRGLPGLVFATAARQAGVINSVEFSAVVLMVTFTTVVGLLLLDRRLAKVAYGEPQTGQQKVS
ncbi:MAG: cation:proton antiporter [Cyanobium sp.]|jgi:Kef-type K+ transport system membrane component KefB